MKNGVHTEASFHAMGSSFTYLSHHLELAIDQRRLQAKPFLKRLWAQPVDPPHWVVGLGQLAPPHRHVKGVAPAERVVMRSGVESRRCAAARPRIRDLNGRRGVFLRYSCELLPLLAQALPQLERRETQLPHLKRQQEEYGSQSIRSEDL